MTSWDYFVYKFIPRYHRLSFYYYLCMHSLRCFVYYCWAVSIFRIYENPICQRVHSGCNYKFLIPQNVELHLNLMVVYTGQPFFFAGYYLCVLFKRNGESYDIKFIHIFRRELCCNYLCLHCFELPICSRMI